jgi:predicted transcriptional regulator
MRINEICKTVDAEILQNKGRLNIDIHTAFAADLMSDTLFIIMREEDPLLLITGVTNLSVVRTASILDIPAVLIVRGKHVPPETIQLAEQNEILLLRSEHIMFVSCGLLYQAGIQGVSWEM